MCKLTCPAAQNKAHDACKYTRQVLAEIQFISCFVLLTVGCSTRLASTLKHTLHSKISYKWKGKAVSPLGQSEVKYLKEANSVAPPRAF